MEDYHQVREAVSSLVYGQKRPGDTTRAMPIRRIQGAAPSSRRLAAGRHLATGRSGSLHGQMNATDMKPPPPRGKLMVDSGTSSPLVQRRRLRTELRKARNEKGLTQQQTATALDWSLSKINRIEKPSTSISTTDLRALLQLYDVTDRARIDELETLAKAARKRPWWTAYRDLAPKALLELIDYEYVGSSIRQYETRVIPGILQTEEYARSVLKIFYEDGPAAQLSALIALRLKRKELLDLVDMPSFRFILDEAAIQRVVGGESVMREQLHYLIEVAGKPNVQMEVVPFSAGLLPGTHDPFEIIEFADADADDVVFLESSHGDIVSDSKDLTEKYLQAFEHVGKAALDERSTVAYLTKIANGMK